MPKRILPIIIIGCVSVLFGFFLSNFTPTKNLGDLIADANIRYFSHKNLVSDKIVIVFLDEATMKNLPYRSPVPRDFLYLLNEKLVSAKPVAIGYDIFFKDPTTASLDQKLSASFKKGPVFAVSAGKLDDSGKEFEDTPMDLFLNSLKGVGLSDFPFSASDSIVRNTQFEFAYDGKPKKTFVSQLYSAATGGNAEALIRDPSRMLSLFGFKFPPYNLDRTRIRFLGPPSKIGSENNLFKIYPANFITEGLVPSDWLKDKVILVGAAYDDGTDAYLTPYYSSRYHYERMPGVEIHANILNSLLTKQFYFENTKTFLATTLAIVALVASLLFLYGGIFRSIISVIGLTIIFAAITMLSFYNFGLIISPIPYEGSMLLSLGLSLGWRSITEGKQKRFIKSVFAKYVPPAVVDKMIANPKMLTLGGEEREITCLFTDIAGFTTISEKLDPTTLVRFLNEYLDRLTRAIFKYGGTLDKYEGDAIIAFFGAPLGLENHRESALLAAIEMQKESAYISEKWKSVCGREINTRIGINSGKAVVGNMGSDLRFDYTAIGDTMNLASRLEGANKFFDTKILVSASSILNASNDLVSRPVAKLLVKGKTEPIKVYELLGLKSELAPDAIEKFMSREEKKEVVELTSK